MDAAEPLGADGCNVEGSPTAPDEEDQKRLEEAQRELERAANLGGHLLSKKACACLKSYRETVTKSHPSITWAEAITNGYEAADKCLSEIIDMARIDLGSDRAPKNN